jgi:hypothetical protein
MASTEFRGGFFLIFGRNQYLHRILSGFFFRFGGNRLHRILEWILFEMWWELPPQNFGVDSF